jgi:hypothetical protein
VDPNIFVKEFFSNLPSMSLWVIFSGFTGEPMLTMKKVREGREGGEEEGRGRSEGKVSGGRRRGCRRGEMKGKEQGGKGTRRERNRKGK